MAESGGVLKSSDITYAGLFYMALVAGGVMPFLTDEVGKSIVKLGLLIIGLYLLPLFLRVGYGRLVLFLHASIVFILLGVFAINSHSPGYALEKVDGASFGVVLPLVFMIILYVRRGEIVFLRSVIVFGFLILLLTLVYKYSFGFFDRGTRFFLNGPNVFGWLMGMLSIFSLYVALRFSFRKYYMFFFVFLCAIVWSESKGALIAVIVACSWLVASLNQGRLSRLLFLSVFSIVILVGSVELLQYLDELLKDTRLSGLIRLIHGGLNETDEGSIGIRQYLLGIAYELFNENIFFGIGLGNFEYYSLTNIAYLHNGHLEVFVECGIFIGIAYLLYVGFLFFCSDNFFRGVALYFIVASLFSGDISYLRFLFCFLIFGALIAPKVRHRSGESAVSLG